MFADESDEVCRLCYHLSSTFTEGVGRITASDQTVQAVHSCISWFTCIVKPADYYSVGILTNKQIFKKYKNKCTLNTHNIATVCTTSFTFERDWLLSTIKYGIIFLEKANGEQY